jgi:hypothetical protein
VIFMGGDLAVPASEDDIKNLVDGWVRELARGAGIPAWEPGPGEQ